MKPSRYLQGTVWLDIDNGTLIRVQTVGDRSVEWVGANGTAGCALPSVLGLHFVPAHGPWISQGRRRDRSAA